MIWTRSGNRREVPWDETNGWTTKRSPRIPGFFSFSRAFKKTVVYVLAKMLVRMERMVYPAQWCIPPCLVLLPWSIRVALKSDPLYNCATGKAFRSVDGAIPRRHFDGSDDNGNGFIDLEDGGSHARRLCGSSHTHPWERRVT